MKEINKLIKNFNKDIICGVGTQIFIQEIEDFKIDKLSNIISSKYKLGMLGENNIFVDTTLKSNDMKLYDNNKNILINLLDYGYSPTNFSESIY